jgi:hypothetical protein
MKIEIHAVPAEQDGHGFLRVKSQVAIIHPTEPGRHKQKVVTAIWDTGATNTCIPMKLALAMGIPLGEPSPLSKMRAVEEQSRFCQFWIVFPDGKPIFVKDALAVPGMQPQFIIGMDIIGKGRTTIEPDGSGGVHFTFTI